MTRIDPPCRPLTDHHLTDHEALEAIHDWWCSLPRDEQPPNHEYGTAAIALVRARLFPAASVERQRQIEKARAIVRRWRGGCERGPQEAKR